ncbi:MAG: porin family protein [Gemmatimonadota bacterium]|nr:porin family protein [Gemmatimonadota bacterium]MDH5804575.1 porin family protein [Gemmatimonadota bacterium]
MKVRVGIFAGAIFLALSAQGAQAQDETWQNQWYWGVQGGGLSFKETNQEFGALVGVHWFVTAARSALYFSFDKGLFSNTSATSDLMQVTGTFSRFQRLQALVYVIPNNAFIQPLLGGGFAINQITNPEIVLTGTETAEQLLLLNALFESATTRASFVFSAGLQIRFGPKMAIFGQYQFMPAAKRFLIDSEQHALSAGIRYAFSGAKEAIGTQR